MSLSKSKIRALPETVRLERAGAMAEETLYPKTRLYFFAT
jgi:hypothetical protein